jgi:hypothetical protein
MQSISAKPLGSYPWLVRLLFRMQGRIFGRVLDSSLLWARSPWVFAAFAFPCLGFSEYRFQSSFSWNSSGIIEAE